MLLSTEEYLLIECCAYDYNLFSRVISECRLSLNILNASLSLLSAMFVFLSGGMAACF